MWELPGPRRFAAEIAAGLVDGHHVLVKVPRTLNVVALLEHAGKELQEQGHGTIHGVWLEAGCNEPEHVLAKAFGMDRRAFASGRDALLYSDPPARVLAILGLDRLSELEMRRWSDLLGLAADVAQQDARAQFLLLVVAPPCFPTPQSNVRLREHAWWAQISEADLDVAIDDALREEPPESAALRLWASHLAKALAPCDPRLARTLISALPRSAEDAVALLSQEETAPVAIEGAVMPGASLPMLEHQAPQPPRGGFSRELWEHGLLDWQRRRGYIVSSVALAKNERIDEIRRRIWCAQQDVLLSEVEAVRCLAEVFLNQLLGTGWEHAVAPDLGSEGDVAKEIGTLCRLVRAYPNWENEVPWVVMKALYEWRAIRNRLAHAQLVDLDQLEVGIDAARALVRATRSAGNHTGRGQGSN